MSSLNEKNVPAKALMKYVPTGHSPKIYIEMAKHLMGVDQNGNDRPFEDLLIFLMTAKRTGLDPMAKQIYPIYRWDSRIGAEKMTIQAGIDGLRATAQKTNLYGGSGDAVFEEKDGRPVKATVTVYKINEKTGALMPTTATARYSEYVQTKVNRKTNQEEVIGLWKKMPYNQLAKCAEALALRKAFPNDLSGVYSEDEMTQANTLELPTPEKVAGKPIGTEQPESGTVVATGGTGSGKSGTKPTKPGTQEAEVVHPETPPVPPAPVKVDEKPEVIQKPVQVSVTPAQRAKNDATFKATAKDGVDKMKLADSDKKISDIRAKLKIKSEIEKLKADIQLYGEELERYEKYPTDTDQFRKALADEKKKQEARRARLAELEAQV